MTVVVPVYNRPELVVRCLESLRAQTWRPLKVLVVDNASSDSTPAAVRRWADANGETGFSVELLFDNRPGAAYARQTGLDHTLTDKVMFFDSDDAMRPDCVECAMEAWKRRPSAEIVAWRVAVHHPDRVVLTHSVKGNLPERHLVHAVLRTQGYAVKASYIRSVGGWRGEFPNWNDLETGTRLLLPDPEVVALDRTFADVFPQKVSITGTSFSEKAGKWEKSLEGIIADIKEGRRTDCVRLLNIVNYRKAILAACYAREGREDLAGKLLAEALAGASSRFAGVLLRFAFHWTKAGLRGAFSIVGPWL